jgi:hypothetical protein
MSPSSPSSSTELPSAPPHVLNQPLMQLEDYLLSLGDSNQESSSLQDRHDEILIVAEFLYGSNLLTAALTLLDSCESMVTKLAASSHRSLYLVKGKDSYYMCFCEPHLHYCSCRSFLEKTTKSSNSKTSSSSNNTTTELCKHLLALKLVPHLNIAFPQITTVTDEEFATLVLDRTLGHVGHHMT